MYTFFEMSYLFFDKFFSKIFEYLIFKPYSDDYYSNFKKLANDIEDGNSKDVNALIHRIER